MIIEGKKATIHQHCATFGNIKTEARTFQVHDPQPYAQHPISVSIGYQEPRQRNWKYIRMVPDNIRYTTIEHDGKVFYDSRTHVPIDMDTFNAKFQENKAEWLKRQAEIDRENAEYVAKYAGRGVSVTASQMGDFRD